MTNAAPDLALNAIVDGIIARVDDSEVDTFGIARLERDLAKLWAASAINVANYHMTRAMLSMIKRNNDAAVVAAREAVRWAGGDYAVLGNCLTVMSTALEMEDAVQLIRTISKQFVDDKNALRDTILKSADLLQFSTSVDLIEKFEKLNINSAPEPRILRQLIASSRDAMTQLGFRDEDLANRLAVVGKTLRKQKLDIWRSSRITLSDGTFMYFVHVNADADRCAELSFDIAEALVESFEDPGSDLFTISCRPAADLAEMNEINPGQL